MRGGVDQVTVDKRWRTATWEIREGIEPEKSLKWLKELKVKYLVVHTQDSKEYYHDFVYPEKFTSISSLRVVYSEDGDIIYQAD